LVALLTVRERPAYPASPRYNGITEVDGQGVPGGPAMSVSLNPGRRTVTYSCPGWFSVDGFPELSYRFEAGVRYELVCEKDPHVEVAR
jgi:hypothetical protein